MRLLLDVENTFKRDGKKTNPSPYEPENKLVSVGLKNIDTGEKEYVFLNHKDLHKRPPKTNPHSTIARALSKATLIVGHHLKHDMSWLYECGFEYDGALYDTMIFEYVCAKGLKPELSLDACAKKYGLPPKLDWFKEQMALGLNTDEMDIDGLEIYGQQDIDTTEALYFFQQDRILKDPEVYSMMPAIQLMNETLPVIIEMERNGCHINLETLRQIEDGYREEQGTLSRLLNEMVVDVMGDTPINLGSSDDLCNVIYSRKVKDKETWKQTFNIGSEERNSVKKAKKPFKIPHSRFKKIIKEQMETVMRTEASQCQVCYGKGRIQLYKKDGDARKNMNLCHACETTGVIYTSTGEHAGFKLQPIDSTYVTQAGFSTDKETLEQLLKRPNLKDTARDFLTGLIRLNAIDTYLSTFIEGIKKNTKADALLHTTLNQCVTSTGRLSSSNPNFQNLPRAKTFPVRKAIQSRWVGGKIMEVDWAALEYRVAILLSKDPAGIESIRQGKDRHAITRDILCAAGQTVDRQESKPHTFKPLYGGTSGTEAEQAYYAAFKEEHAVLSAWQKGLAETALTKKQIQSPSGRIYAFPNARRVSGDYISGQTQIYNYLIQGFATADIMPAVLVELHKQMKAAKVNSKLILTVHDSVEIDIYPGEVDKVSEIVYNSFSCIEGILYERFGFECVIPLTFEAAIGDNWMEKQEIKYA